ncbi:modifier of mdg4-like isoform X4 [Bacillus rossius redtenbacheri]|uniref:modifier of mdg4-like isoform X4 n=1 Tax=Bacillus rossius redtenbacheri TaxID=93214 RepID=UPI002FDD51A1
MANADEQFSLRWNNFHSNLSSGFHAFLQGEDLVDVTLAAGGKFLQAHKLVLSVCSPYFKELFKVNPCKHPIVILKDVGHKELEDILEFMYRGEVNVRQDDLTEFLKTAEMLQVKGLTGDESNSDQQGSSQVPPPSPAPLQSSVKVKPRKPQPKAPPVDSMPPSPMTDDMPTRSPAADLNPPPFKRMKQESQSQPSPQQQFKQETQSQQQYKTQSLSSPSPRRLPPASPLSIADDSSRGVEFVEVTKPKMEPVDIESDVEEVDAGIDDKTDFSDFFGGESSQSHQDAPGMGMLPGMSMSGMSQDMGMPQDGGQGGEGGLCFVSSTRGKPQLVHRDYLFTAARTVGGRTYWRCADIPRLKCPARIITQGGSMEVRVATHNHCSHAAKIRQRRVADYLPQLLGRLAEARAQ